MQEGAKRLAETCLFTLQQDADAYTDGILAKLKVCGCVGVSVYVCEDGEKGVDEAREKA